MTLLIYPRLSTRSKRSFQRRRNRNGDYRYYIPHPDLMQRLIRETGLAQDAVLEQIEKERAALFSILL
jgi:hypothetical protein